MGQLGQHSPISIRGLTESNQLPLIAGHVHMKRRLMSEMPEPPLTLQYEHLIPHYGLHLPATHTGPIQGEIGAVILLIRCRTAPGSRPIVPR